MSALGLRDVRQHTLFPTLVVSAHGKRVLVASHFWPPVVLEGEHSPAPLSSFFTAKSHPQDCMFLLFYILKGLPLQWDTDGFTGITLISVFGTGSFKP